LVGVSTELLELIICFTVNKLTGKYLVYQLFIMVLKFDLFYFIGFTLQFIVLVLDKKDLEYGLTIIAIPFTFVILFICLKAVTKEKVWLTVISIIGMGLGLFYFLFKLYRILLDKETKYKYESIKIFLTIFDCLSICMLILSILLISKCWANYGSGLKKYLENKHFLIKENRDNFNLEE
jgi:hypothetical protein